MAGPSEALSLQGPRFAREETASIKHLTWHLDTAGAQWVVAIILTTVMELMFDDNILIVLTIWFLIGPSLSRLALEL